MQNLQKRNINTILHKKNIKHLKKLYKLFIIEYFVYQTK